MALMTSWWGTTPTGFTITKPWPRGLPSSLVNVLRVERGLKVSEEKLLEAVLSQSRHFQFPWRYAFAMF